MFKLKPDSALKCSGADISCKSLSPRCLRICAPVATNSQSDQGLSRLHLLFGPKFTRKGAQEREAAEDAENKDRKHKKSKDASLP